MGPAIGSVHLTPTTDLAICPRRDLEEALPTLHVAADGIWIADATGDRLVRVTEGGTITGEVRPGTPAYACVLGGSDGRTLFACAAPDFNDEARKAATEGRLVAVRV